MAQVPTHTNNANPQEPPLQVSHQRQQHPDHATQEPGPGPLKSKPLRKRAPHRRSPQACDECRLRKRACDAVEPCGPCRASRLVCTFSFRRPIPPPTTRIRDLQSHLQLARSWLQDIQKKVPTIPGLDIDECLRVLDYTQPEADSPPVPSHPSGSAAVPDDATGQDCDRAPVDRYGSGQAGLDGQVYYGVFSEVTFLLRMLQFFAPCMPGSETEHARLQVVSGLFARPLPNPKISDQDKEKWPAREALALIDVTLSRRHSLLAFLPEAELGKLVQAPASQSGQIRPLVQFAIALGHVLDTEEHRSKGCESCQEKGLRRFHMGMASMNLLNVNSIESLQAILCAIVFLMLTSRFASAHPLIGIASSAAHRLGLHEMGAREGLSGDPMSTRLFATLVVLDLSTGLLLDVPPFIHVDQDLASRLVDLAVQAERADDLRTAALLRQGCLLAIPLPTSTYHGTTPLDNPDPYLYAASLRNLENVKNSLRRWKSDAAPLIARLNGTRELLSMKKDLEITYDFCQIILFRPHLHHLQAMADGGSISAIKSHHALACLRVSSSHIVRYHKMTDRASILAGTWLPPYTVFMSVLCLCFLIAAHSGTSRPSVAWQKAVTGIQLLVAYECSGGISAGCLEVLKMVTRELSHTVFFDFDELVLPLHNHCRDDTTPRTIDLFPTLDEAPLSTSSKDDHSTDRSTPAYLHSYSSPEQDGADQMLVDAQDLGAELDFRHLLDSIEVAPGAEAASDWDMG